MTSNDVRCARCGNQIPYSAVGYLELNPKTDKFDLVCSHDTKLLAPRLKEVASK
ncbi:MAG: hypothetical protein JRN67_05950 [Nitrososphaerota archaeon]|nr:hypothetical protein [Nitrososphaerota archaeon]